jgi:hypothetical protein
MDVRRPGATAELLSPRIQPHERTQPGTQRPGTKLASSSSRSAAIPLACGLDIFVIPNDSSDFSTRRNVHAHAVMP